MSLAGRAVWSFGQQGSTLNAKKAKALRRLVYRGHDEEQRRYVPQVHKKPAPKAPELNLTKVTILATDFRRFYQDVKRMIKEKKLPRK